MSFSRLLQKKCANSIHRDVQVQKIMCVWCLIIMYKWKAIFRLSNIYNKRKKRVLSALNYFVTFFSVSFLLHFTRKFSFKLRILIKIKKKKLNVCVGFIFRRAEKKNVHRDLVSIKVGVESPAMQQHSSEQHLVFINTQIWIIIEKCEALGHFIPLSLAYEFSCWSSRSTCVIIESI